MGEHQTKSSGTVSRRKMTRLGLGTVEVLVACAVAGLALLLSWPAAAQTVICDTDFLTNNWLITPFSCPAAQLTQMNNTVTATQQSTGGSLMTPSPAACPVNGYYRDITNSLKIAGTGGGPTCPAESIIYAVHTFSGTNTPYDPAVSGAIASISFQIDYQCPDSVAPASVPCTGNGQAFGPALVQNGKYFIANTAGSATGMSPSWKRFSSTPLLATAFNQISVGMVSGNAVVTIDTNSHPEFSVAAPPIQCGFYTANSTRSGPYTIQAGYDNWACTITPVGILKICKVAGPGIAVGSPFSFTANSIPLPLPVPAGPGPGGTCVIGGRFPVGTTVTIVEIPQTGIAVSNITVAVAPPSNMVSTSPTTGTAVVMIGNGVTEVTYTDYKTTGYLEICKTGAAGGSFMVGNLGPFAVPVGACSPAIEVTAGPVSITEAPNVSGIAIDSCTTIPPGRVTPCPQGTLTAIVTVVPGDIPSETIVTINNGKSNNSPPR
jgi:hypothetical protein